MAVIDANVSRGATHVEANYASLAELFVNRARLHQPDDPTSWATEQRSATSKFVSLHEAPVRSHEEKILRELFKLLNVVFNEWIHIGVQDGGEASGDCFHDFANFGRERDVLKSEFKSNLLGSLFVLRIERGMQVNDSETGEILLFELVEGSSGLVFI